MIDRVEHRAAQVPEQNLRDLQSLLDERARAGYALLSVDPERDGCSLLIWQRVRVREPAAGRRAREPSRQDVGPRASGHVVGRVGVLAGGE